jgi:hypothetical protein
MRTPAFPTPVFYFLGAFMTGQNSQQIGPDVKHAQPPGHNIDRRARQWRFLDQH